MSGSWNHVYLHATWATWDRLPLLTNDVEADVFREMAIQCKRHGSEALAVNGVQDHVHVLIRMSPTSTIAGLVRAMKSATSNQLGKEFRWQGGYGVRSIDPTRIPDVLAYIRDQKAHHRRGDLVDTLEDRPEHRD